MTAAERAALRLARADTAAQLHAAGWSKRQIARFLHVSDSTIRSDLHTAAAPLHPSHRPRPWVGDWRPEAVRLRASGHPDHRSSQAMPVWMISERLGVSERDVRRYFARLRKREARADRAVWLRTGGQSLRQIATALGVSVATVQRARAESSHRPSIRTRDRAAGRYTPRQRRAPQEDRPMKTPAWFSDRLAETGAKVRAGEISDSRAVTALSRSVLASRPLMAMLAADFARRELARWLRRRSLPGEQAALFPALPAELDVAPGTFRAQGSMTATTGRCTCASPRTAATTRSTARRPTSIASSPRTTR